MTLVVDASVALKWVIPEDRDEAAKALLSETMVAPELWLLEIANAIWKRSRRGEFPPSTAAELLQIMMVAPVRRTPIELDLAAALQLAGDLQHPVYDCLYLAAALREDTVVVTDDARFVRAVEGTAYAGRVRRLGA